MEHTGHSLHPALVLTDGGVESLIALAIATEDPIRADRSQAGPRPFAVAASFAAGLRGVNHGGAVSGGPVPGLMLEAARAHAERFGADVRAVDAISLAATQGDRGSEPREGDPFSCSEALISGLLRAAYLAGRLGCDRLVWPVSAVVREGVADAGDALGAIARIIDTATLVARLVGLDADHLVAGEVRIDTPFVDLSAAQLLELADDLRLELARCWFAAKDASLSAAAQAERARWDSPASVSA